MERPWFERWFASPYYHILYKERDEREAQFFLDNLINLLKPIPGSKMLDVACGRGRHSVYLNKKGYEVAGIDLSEESIAYDKQFENEKLSFHVHDMREVFKAAQFDYVFNLFSSFGYFDTPADNSKAVEAHSQALKTGGMLVLDYMNASKVCSCFIPSEKKVVEGIKFSVRKKIEGGMIVKRISFSDKGKDYNFEEHLSILLLEDFQKLFTQHNLKITHTFGDYALNTFDDAKSDRLILIAEKTA
jgi:SAM-dependent methyltransferase